MQSNERSETSQQTNTAPRSGSEGTSGLEKLRALMASESETTEEGEAGESQENAQPEAGKPKGKPKALKDLAERLELAPEDLYGVELTTGTGKKVTLGSLKDLADKSDDLQVRELELEERRSKQEAEWTRAQQEQTALLAMIDQKAITPELRDAVKKRVDADLKRERELTLKAIPEWANDTVRDTELAGMTELLKDYGISEHLLTATMSHKMFRFVRDAYLRKARIEKALAKVVEVKKPSATGKSGGGRGAPPKPDASAPSTRQSPRERLRALMNS